MMFLVKGVSWPYSWFERWLIIGGWNWIGFNEGSHLSKWLPSIVVNRHFFYLSVLLPFDKRLRVVWGSQVRRECRGVSVNGKNLITGEQW